MSHLGQNVQLASGECHLGGEDLSRVLVNAERRFDVSALDRVERNGVLLQIQVLCRHLDMKRELQEAVLWITA